MSSMDAAKVTPMVSQLTPTDSTSIKLEKKSREEIISQEIANKNISQLTEKELQELPVSEKIAIKAIEEANKKISVANRRFEYSVHEKSKAIMIKVIDTDTNEIVKEIPPEKVLDIVAKMWELVGGVFVDERR